MNVRYDDVVNAQKTQDDVIRKTSLTFSDTFTQLTGSIVYLKNEFEQKTGSFKLREHIIKLKHCLRRKEKTVWLLPLLATMDKALHTHQPWKRSNAL